MGSGPKNPANSDGNTSSFTVDEPSHTTEVPSVTKLLNRRSLQIGAKGQPAESDGATSLFKKSAVAPPVPEPPALEQPAAPEPPALEIAPVEVAVEPAPAAASAAPDFAGVQLEAVSAQPVSVDPDIQLSAPGLEVPIASSPDPVPAPSSSAPPAVEILSPMEESMAGSGASAAPSDGLSIALDASSLELETSASSSSAADSAGSEQRVQLAQGDLSFSKFEKLANQGSEPEAEEPAVAQSYEPTPVAQIEVDPEALALPPTPRIAAAKVKVQPAARKAKPRGQLNVWELERLKQSRDPMGQILVQLIHQRLVTHALFLSISPPPAGSPLPHFVAHAAVHPDHKLPFWTGLRWDPTLIPEMWNHFVKTGILELSPPGTVTNLKSNRNVVRGAFGIVQSEWLTLVRVGPANACRGVLVLVSPKTVVPTVQSLLPQLAAPTPSAA